MPTKEEFSIWICEQEESKHILLLHGNEHHQTKIAVVEETWIGSRLRINLGLGNPELRMETLFQAGVNGSG